MKIKISQLDTINETVLYLILFATPLTFVFVTRELFEFPKMILVYFLSAMLSGLFLAQKGFRKMALPAGSKAFFLLATAITVSTLFSVNRYTSIFGYYSRFNGGLLSLLAFALILLSAAAFLKRRVAAACVNAILISGALVSFYAVLQNFGIDKSFWVQDSQARAFSTLGQPNWLSAYILVILPIPLFKFLNAEETSKKFLFFMLFLLYYFAFWATYSLSGFLGLLAFGILFLTGSFGVAKAKWKQLLLLGVACAAVSLARPGIFGAKIKSFMQIVRPVVSITREALAADDRPQTQPLRPRSIDTGDIRLGVWQGSLRLRLSSPKNFLIGTGPETFAYAFLPFRPLSLNKTTEWDFLYNKAHNYYLDILTGTGILGFLAYVLFVITTAAGALKSGARAPDGLPRLMLYGWSTILITNFFGWPTVVLSLLFFLYPLLIDRLDRYGVERAGSVDGEEIHLPDARALLVSAACLILILGTINIFLADVSFTQGYGSSESGDILAAEPALKDAIRLNPWEPAYHKGLAYTYAQKYAETEDGNDLSQALKEAKIAYDLNPHNSLTLRSLIRVYYLLSKVNPQYKTDLEKLALEIIRLSPTEPRSYYDAALMFYYSGDSNGAKELNDEAIKLRPGYPEALELAPKLTATPSVEKK